jgi:hypothetical protein
VLSFLTQDSPTLTTTINASRRLVALALYRKCNVVLPL